MAPSRPPPSNLPPCIRRPPPPSASAAASAASVCQAQPIHHLAAIPSHPHLNPPSPHLISPQPRKESTHGQKTHEHTHSIKCHPPPPGLALPQPTRTSLASRLLAPPPASPVTMPVPVPTHVPESRTTYATPAMSRSRPATASRPCASRRRRALVSPATLQPRRRHPISPSRRLRAVLRAPHSTAAFTLPRPFALALHWLWLFPACAASVVVVVVVDYLQNENASQVRPDVPNDLVSEQLAMRANAATPATTRVPAHLLHPVASAMPFSWPLRHPPYYTAMTASGYSQHNVDPMSGESPASSSSYRSAISRSHSSRPVQSMARLPFHLQHSSNSPHAFSHISFSAIEPPSPRPSTHGRRFPVPSPAEVKTPPLAVAGRLSPSHMPKHSPPNCQPSLTPANAARHATETRLKLPSELGATRPRTQPILQQPHPHRPPIDLITMDVTSVTQCVTAQPVSRPSNRCARPPINPTPGPG
ncbi:hypothetical protein PCL_11292 [Purpureocillium lilacinum]|uniref:Uncharacterized protein n=1 Tax=Purpureocillium lilacinum TaxID=33203 RepID=A0A2U3DPX2_PURLI|nr:hypothetical protein Purlil1_5250 [Purpureocillium lilacinum]PWI64289.1 hypothetical protein PCL_11292 [Purpureocillium lilacinum]